MYIDPFQLDALRRQLNSLAISKQLVDQWMAREGGSMAKLTEQLARTTGSPIVQEAAIRAQLIGGLATEDDLLKIREGIRSKKLAQSVLQEFQDHAASHSIYFEDPDGHRLEITTYDV